MDFPKFSKNDSGFTCVFCGEIVKPLGKTSRNHCPNCLCSLHVDINPGDRQNPCKGLLEPQNAIVDSKKGLSIVFRCSKCGFVGKNKSADDDNFDLILRLQKNQK